MDYSGKDPAVVMICSDGGLLDGALSGVSVLVGGSGIEGYHFNMCFKQV